MTFDRLTLAAAAAYDLHAVQEQSESFAPPRKNMLNRFEIILQYARAPESSESRSIRDYSEFLFQFRQFDWLSETNRCFWARSVSPGIAVRNTQTDATLAVVSHDVLSAIQSYRQPNSLGWIDFILILTSGWSPLAGGFDDATRPIQGYSTPRKPEVETAYELFFEDADRLPPYLQGLSKVALKQ